MKKSTIVFSGLFVFILSFCLLTPARGQEGHSVNSAEVCSGVQLSDYQYNKGSRAMWDQLFSYNLSDTLGTGGGWAGICEVNGEIWVSKWGSDTIANMTAQGGHISSFLIAGLTGVRSLTFDGTYLYAGVNTTTIYRIDPATKTLAPPHITVAATARWITFDQTLNAGAGGFWYGNFNTDITAVDMNGTVLSVILAATHTLTGMYGAAVDHVSVGGPYLWVFAQMGTNNSQITGLNLGTGTPTSYTHDAMPDAVTAHGLTSGLAGGMNLSTTISPGNVALLGLLQGTPDNIIFAYDVETNFSLTDIAISELRSVDGYTRIPLSQLTDQTFTFTVSNLGTEDIDSLYAQVDVYFDGNLVHTALLNDTNLMVTQNRDYTFGPYSLTNGIGLYSVQVLIIPGSSQTDEDSGNDLLSFEIQVTDSVFSRDNGIPDGSAGYSVSSTDWAYALTNFTLAVDDTLTGIWIQLVNPVLGDTTYAVVANTVGELPVSVHTLGTVQIIDNAQTDYYLQFTSPVVLTAGTYSFGCYEGAISMIGLTQCASVFSSGANFFYTPTSGWLASGIQTARFIRPVFASGSLTENTAIAAENYFDVYPNPGQGLFNLVLPQIATNSKITVFDSFGRQISSFDTDGKNLNLSIDLKGYPSGFYYLKVENNSYCGTRKIVIVR